MVAPGQTPGQEDAPADTARARPDKTQGPEGQMAQGGAALVGEQQPSATGRGSRKSGAKRTRSRPTKAWKTTKTKRKAGRAGGTAKRTAAPSKKAKRPTGARTGGGRKTAKKAPKKSGRRTTAKTPTKKRAGTGKAGGKRNR